MVDGRAMRIDANDKLSLAHGRGRDGAMVPADDPDTLKRRRRT